MLTNADPIYICVCVCLLQEGERKRIEGAGGMVRGNRVNGDLAVRA